MITIINYGMGNLRSLAKSLEYIGANVTITSNPTDLNNANAIILPGIGAFRDGMKNLKETKMDKAIIDQVINKKKPFLGICLGMQLIAQKSYEFGEHQGLGLVDCEVVKFDLKDFPIPHVGWNNVNQKKEHQLFKNINNNKDFYFVHSYHLTENKDITIGETDYGYTFPSVIAKDNIMATQFHPEKSQKDGLQILQNFLDFTYVKE